MPSMKASTPKTHTWARSAESCWPWRWPDRQMITESQILERMRKICLPLAGTEEKLTHGHPAFATSKGIYAVLEEYRGDLSICVKVGKEMQGIFLKDPRFYSTPYIG